MTTPPTVELRCAACGRKLGEAAIERGTVVILCRRTECKHRNVYAFPPP